MDYNPTCPAYPISYIEMIILHVRMHLRNAFDYDAVTMSCNRIIICFPFSFKISEPVSRDSPSYGFTVWPHWSCQNAFTARRRSSFSKRASRDCYGPCRTIWEVSPNRHLCAFLPERRGRHL